MPEESKKNQDKRKNDPKEQRKPRNSRNHAGKVERTHERVEESKSVPKVTVPQKPPVYADPGIEFYKNLKRETEEILKITEAENSKYKKKEIQSNWSKYEMPIESYEEIEDHDVGADYEKLIQAPLSVGGHFQFKHEKSWDVNTGPSLYDKYFEINMDNLSLAISTIPFYERNGIEKSLFSETDMLSMNNRATKYKQKYHNDKSYATPETEAQDKILNSLKQSLCKNDSEKIETESIENEDQEIVSEIIKENRSASIDDINLDFENMHKTNIVSSLAPSVKKTQIVSKTSVESILSQKLNEVVLQNVPENNTVKQVKIENIADVPEEIIETKIDVNSPGVISSDAPIADNFVPKIETASQSTDTNINTKPKDKPAGTIKNPVIESPEDLEKWLDDFLDG